MSRQTTLCYIEKGDEYLMLHRIKKKNDENHDKWIGVGGGLEYGESPEDCMKREIFEETGLEAEEWQYRGIVTFVSDEFGTEYMHLFKVTSWHGTPHECAEGVLEWIPKRRLPELPAWEGDRIFLELLESDTPFFSLKLVYGGENLVSAVLNGKTRIK